MVWSIMASVPVLLLHLLLVSLASASHNFGGSATYTYKGKNPDGSYKVSIIQSEKLVQMHSQSGNFTLLYDLCNNVFVVLLWLHHSDYRKKVFTKAREACEYTNIYLRNMKNPSISISAITSANILFFHRLALDIYAEPGRHRVDEVMSVFFNR